MLINERKIRKIVRKILKEEDEINLKKVSVYKRNPESVIGGDNYLKMKTKTLAIALDSDGVLYYRKIGKGGDFIPISDSDAVINLTNSIKDKFSDMDFVKKALPEMEKRKKQAEENKKIGGDKRIKELLNKYFSYIKSKGNDQVWLRWPYESKEKTPESSVKLSKRWGRLIKEYQAHLKKSGFSDAVIKGNGSRRDMYESSDTKNKARAKGTNHGLAFALDVNLGIKSIMGKEKFKAVTDNHYFANNVKFVKASQEFADKNPDLIWGGTYKRNNIYNPSKKVFKITGRGKTEIHHWELKPEKYADYMDKDFYELIELLNQKTGCGTDISTTTSRIPIYRAIYQTFHKLFPYKKDIAWSGRSSDFKTV